MHCSIVRIKQISMQRTPLKIIATLVVRPCQRVYKKNYLTKRMALITKSSSNPARILLGILPEIPQTLFIKIIRRIQSGIITKSKGMSKKIVKNLKHQSTTNK